MKGEFRGHDTCCPPKRTDWVGRFIGWMDEEVWTIRVILILCALVPSAAYGCKSAARAMDRRVLEDQIIRDAHQSGKLSWESDAGIGATICSRCFAAGEWQVSDHCNECSATRGATVVDYRCERGRCWWVRE